MNERRNEWMKPKGGSFIAGPNYCWLINIMFVYWIVKLIWLNFGHIVDPKFGCLTHSEAKQTETSEFGAEKDLLQGSSKNGQLLLKKPKIPDGFQGRVFIGNIWGRKTAGCVTFLWSVVRKRGQISIISHLTPTSLGVQVLVPSLKLPSSTWVGSLSSSRRTQRYIVTYTPSGGTRTLLCAALLFPECAFVSAFPPFPN